MPHVERLMGKIFAAAREIDNKNDHKRRFNINDRTKY